MLKDVASDESDEEIRLLIEADSCFMIDGGWLERLSMVDVFQSLRRA